MERKNEILRKSLDLFNEKGLHKVGVRDIAKSLDISPGNLSYHYPKKVDIIIALFRQVIELNRPLHEEDESEDYDIIAFLKNFKRLQINQWQFRCLYYNLASLMREYSEELSFIHEEETVAKNNLKNNLKHLISANDIKRMHPFELEMFTIKINLLKHCWISESEISLYDMTELEKRTKNIRLLGAILEKYTTKQGFDSLRNFMKEL